METPKGTLGSVRGTGQPTGNSEAGLWGWGDSSCSPTPQVPHAGSRALLSTTAGSADHSQRQQPRTALCPRRRAAQHGSSSTGTLLAAPFCAGANAQTDPTAQLVSSSLQVINEIIYCSLLGFCQNTRKKKKKRQKSTTLTASKTPVTLQASYLQCLLKTWCAVTPCTARAAPSTAVTRA